MSLVYSALFSPPKKPTKHLLPLQVAEERIATIRTVRAFAHERKECEAYSQGIEGVLNLSYKESLARGFFWGFVSKLFVYSFCVQRF